MKHIYNLQRIDIWGKRYPSRRTEIVSMGYFSACEIAIEAMQTFLADESNYDHECKHPSWLGFVITQYNVDSEDNNRVKPIYQCSYTHDGRFNDENLAGPDGVFRGRPIEKTRFVKGDIVEVCEGDRSTLGVVYSTPFFPEKCARLMTPDEKGRFLELDSSDDQYTVLFLSNTNCRDDNMICDKEWLPIHDHIQSQFLFKPTKPIPRSIAKRLRHLLL